MAAIALVAGLVRGFSGFGSGMIFVPPVSFLVGPKVAVAAFWVMDTLPTLPLLFPALPRVQWKTVLPVAAGNALTVWLGVWWLANGDPETLRWAISGFILAGVAFLWSGWRYHGPRPVPLSLAVGGVSGLAGGAAQLSGPPVLIYWLASEDPAWQVRANVIVLFFVITIVSGLTMFMNGLLVRSAIVAALVCAPLYALGLIAGQRYFAHATDTGYRRFAFVLILTVAIVTLPVFDRFLR